MISDIGDESMFKVKSKAEFDMYKPNFSTLISVEENLGVLTVSECTEDIKGIFAKIKDIDCVITKKGVIIEAGIQVDSPTRAMKIGSLSNFFVWRHDNVFELIKRIIISDLIEAQILLSGSYNNIVDFETNSGMDVYKYFYTDATEEESKQVNKLVSLSQYKYSGSLICSPLRIQKYDRDALILSRANVKQHGEVLTPPNIVSDMLDLVGKEYKCNLGIEEGTLPIDKTFLEPSCGTGNFLVQILERKLRLCTTKEEVFRAVASIYGVDIQKDNVLESRLRMLEIVEAKFSDLDFLTTIADVLEKNIIGGDMLADRRGCVIGNTWVKGTVRNATGTVENDGISHDRLIAYTWSWGYPVTNKVEYLIDDEE